MSGTGNRSVPGPYGKKKRPSLRIFRKMSKKSGKPSENGSMRSASSLSDVSITSSLGQQPYSSQLHRTGSIRSAIGKLDNILAVEDCDDNIDELTATLRRRPTNRRVRSPELQDIFARNEQSSQSHPQQAQTFSAASGRRFLHVIPPALPCNSSVVVDEIAHSGSTYPSSKTLGRSNTFTANVSATSRSPVFPVTSSNSYGTSGSFDSASVSSTSPRKGAPPPPTRKTSRLTTNSQAPPSSFQAPSTPSTSLSLRPQQDTAHTQNPHKTSPQTYRAPRIQSPSVTQSQGQGFSGGSNKPGLSGIAAAVAVQAQQRQRRLSSSGSSDCGSHNISTKPSSSVARQSDRNLNSHSTVNESGNSALSIALAAKQASLKQQSRTESHVQIKPDETNSKPTQEEMRELVHFLPPPPPPSVHNLPPPPSLAYKPNQSSTYSEMVLPPPPDIMLSTTIPSPPLSFSNDTKSAKSSSVMLSPSRFKDHRSASPSKRNSVSSNGLDAVSIADSGVDDVGSNNRNNHETLSVVSSLSTMSSEEGSDAGVSLSFDPKSNSEHNVGNSYLDNLKKNKTSLQNPDNKMMLTKVNFISSKSLPTSFDGSRHKPDRVDVTIQSPASKNTKQAHATAATKSDYENKPVVEWNVNDVCEWLSDLGLGVHAQIFEENEIVGSHLPDLGKDDLQELGVTRVGHRLTIERSLKKLTGK